METFKEEFLDWLKTKELKPKSINEYKTYLIKLELFNAFNQETINLYLKANNHKVARAFISNYKKFLVESKKDIFTLDKINEFKGIDIPKITGKQKVNIPEVLSIEEIKAIEYFITEERYKIMLWLSFYSGLRVDGLVKVTANNINWNRWETNKEYPAEIIIQGKGGRQYKTLIPSELVKRIQDFIRFENSKLGADLNPNKPLFKRHAYTWSRHLSEASKKAINRSVNPHLLRHSSATYWLSKGYKIEEVKELLGHSSIVSTQIYTHLVLDDLKTKQIAILKQENNHNNIPTNNPNSIGDSLLISPSNISPINNSPEQPNTKEYEKDKDIQNKEIINPIEVTEREKHTQDHDKLSISPTESTPTVINESNNKEYDTVDTLPQDNVIAIEMPINKPKDETKTEYTNTYDVTDDSKFDVLIESYEEEY